mmetsp:Transcript_40790/g.49670  ORF Transcript_40790/g.49670 Transcript_40790/m.49670 type:complete len:308 (-) Transcript_40790:27-950(-)|eukprot:CAMPEP_0172512914 /NCGR_PEP_ID=MMETSP1066-20121228/248095_1 /TAXON_ID=671091 /ORGANISM="Coscinodiscus wailesii, Strain CCMP2513" /LENGTH=307 /DNA_ID=CAMNT_0013292923 /DNA_START=144 /DNA_END=1067 /DNA_ORIENTATION=+
MASSNGGNAPLEGHENGSAMSPSPKYGSLNVDNVSDQMWLVRIPPKLASVWNNAKEGTIIGELTFTMGTNAANNLKGVTTNKQQPQNKRKVLARMKPHAQNNKGKIKQSLAVSVSPELSTIAPDLPLRYTVEAMTKQVPVMHPFTRHEDKSVTLNGVVSRSASLQMQVNTQYRQLCKKRLIENVTSDRYVRPVDVSELSMRGVTSGLNGEGFGKSVQTQGKKILEASERESFDGIKKHKFEGQSTRSVVFHLFSQKRYWMVKELRNASGRPEKELRPVLAELCEFHRNGDQKGTWELKKEFQMQEEA